MTDEKCNILLVDDRPENLLALEAVLAPLNQTLVTATSGEDALKHLLDRDFALILLDVQMPGMDGFETATQIKERPKTKEIPIIFITAISQEPHHALRGYSTGAVDYLFKPFDPWALRTKVSVFIDLHRKNKLLAQTEAVLRKISDSLDQLKATALPADAAAHVTRARDAVEELTGEKRNISA